MGAAGPYRHQVWPMLLGRIELAVLCQEPCEQVLGAATLVGSEGTVSLVWQNGLQQRGSGVEERSSSSWDAQRPNSLSST